LSVSTMASARLPPDFDPLEHADALIAANRADEAAALLGDLIAQDRGGLLARLAYTRALISAGNIDSALESARETAQLFSGVAAAAVGLGEALLKAGRLPTAIGEFQRALRIDAELADARYLLGCAWLEAGEPEKALQEFDAIPPERRTQDLSNRIAEAAAMRAEPRANARYVRHLFDQFSSDYDSCMLEQLAYSAPQILRELANLVWPAAGKDSLAILDLGCGTGLTGLAFRDLARQLDGIDLSPAMIERAERRGIYDKLTVGDVERPLSNPDHYDLVAAADTLVYLGDLSGVFATVCESLKAGGFFLFTVEKKEAEGFDLGPKRRWRHSETYLRTESQRARFEVAGMIACSPRTEAGQPVEGLAVALRKR
jgi:predicted TPR repeat methyltransferase